MREKKTQQARGIGVGMASVLMIVMVLALTCFGLLALVSARADGAVSSRAEHFTTAYSAAEGRLQRQLADLDAALALGTRRLTGPLQLVEQVQDGQQLVMEVVPPPTGSAQRYAITYCVLVNTGEWAPDEGMNLWTQEE